MGFDFGSIGNIVSQVMDTDYIDIKRDVAGTLTELYSNIPCHIAFGSVDNADPTTIDVKPIIETLTIHCGLYVDIQNNDYIIAKKIGSNGELLFSYNGRCGNPTVSQGRKSVSMTMNSSGEEPTPTPIKDPAIITITYTSNAESIKNNVKVEYEAGETVTIDAPSIDGYTATSCVIDGEEVASTSATFIEITKGEHIVQFVYEVSTDVTYFRILVNGLYSKNDGTLAKGYHFYKKVETNSVEKENDVYTIVCDNINWIHDENGKEITIAEGDKLLLSDNTWVIITSIQSVILTKVTFTAEVYTPTTEESNAYICNWYD